MTSRFGTAWLRPAGWLVTAALMLPPTAQSHELLMRYNLPVPFDLYLYACAAALLITFALMAWFMRAPAGAAGTSSGRARRLARLPASLILMLQAGALLCLGMTLLSGLIGTQDPDDNLNLTLFWQVFLLGFVYASAVIGNLYGFANPWKAMARLLRLEHSGRYKYPAALGYWPAVVLYIALIWLELFTIPGPQALSIILILYTGITLAGAWCFGSALWFEHCEVFAVLLRLVGMLAPIQYRPESAQSRAGVSVLLRWPLVGVLEEQPRAISFVAFVLCLLAGTTYDGMHQTLFWKGIYWHHLLPVYHELGGKHVPDATVEFWYSVYQRLGLVAFPFLYLCLYLAILRIGKAVAGTVLSVHTMAVAFVLSILPIALVYNMAHYYTLILIRLPALPYLITDPFGYEWNPLSLPHLGDPPILRMAMVWHVEVGLILAGHIAAVWLAHRIALDVFASRRDAVLSQMPMLLLMLVYTVVGLWVISLPFALT